MGPGQAMLKSPIHSSNTSGTNTRTRHTDPYFFPMSLHHEAYDYDELSLAGKSRLMNPTARDLCTVILLALARVSPRQDCSVERSNARKIPHRKDDDVSPCFVEWMLHGIVWEAEGAGVGG